MRSSASSFGFQYPVYFLRSSSSFLCLLPRFPVTSTLPSICPSIKCYRWQFLCKMWPTQLTFLLTACRKLLSSFALSDTCSFLTRSVQLIFSVLLHHNISKLSEYFYSTVRTVQVSTPHKATPQMQHFTSFFLNFMSNLLAKRDFVLLNAAFAMTTWIYCIIL